MKYKKISVASVLLLLLIPISNAAAFSFIDNIKDGNYIFFLVDLDIGENLELSIAHDGSGNFTLFLFNARPTESYVNNDKTLNTKIFINPHTLAHSIDNNPYVNFTATEAKIYYIEIILVSGGPDTFTLISLVSPNDKELTRYYLPIIPGFQLEYIIISFLISLGTIYLVYKKKIKK